MGESEGGEGGEGAGDGWTLYTAGYRDANDQRRLRPEEFYGGLPEEAVVVDIRSHPYSPFAPAYIGSGVRDAVRALKPGRTEFYHVGDLGNTHKDANGRRVNPPLLRNPEAGYARLEEILAEHGTAVIFCACSLATWNDPLHRCHRFAVAEEMRRRFPGVRVVHLPRPGTAAPDQFAPDMAAPDPESGSEPGEGADRK